MKKLLYILIFLIAVQVQGWCATKYLRNIGGATNWNDPNSWSSTSGGPADTTAPGFATDITICDPNSGSTNLVINTIAGIALLNMTGFTGTLSGSSAMGVYGNITFSAGMTNNYTGAITAGNNSTLTTNGITLNSVINSSVAKTMTLGSDLITTKQIDTDYGLSVNTANYNITCTSFLCNDTVAQTITLGSSTINCTSLDFSGTNLTLTANTATINCTGAFAGGGKTYGGTVNLTGSTGTIAVTGANTYGNLSITGAANKTGIFTFGANQTVTGTFTCNGNSAINKLALKSSDTTVRTITAATVNVSNIDYYQNIKGAGDGWIGKVPFFNSALSWNPTMKYSGVLR